MDYNCVFEMKKDLNVGDQHRKYKLDLEIFMIMKLTLMQLVWIMTLKTLLLMVIFKK